MEKLKRIIEFLPAWDKRSPNPEKNYGLHGVEMRWYIKGSLGIIQFVLYTNWQLPKVQKEIDSYPPNIMLPYLLHKPLPADIGYHSPKARYKGQESMKCSLLPQGKCYYDGSSLRASNVFDLLCSKGDKAVWEYLEAEYKDIFL